MTSDAFVDARGSFFFVFVLYLVARDVVVGGGLGDARCDSFFEKLIGRCDAFNGVWVAFFFGLIVVRALAEHRSRCALARFPNLFVRFTNLLFESVRMLW
jgi:hypothetical protein